jgi:hypothetical protein
MSNTNDFVNRVCESMVNGTDAEVHLEIEIAYDECIVPSGISKADFMEELLTMNPGVFSRTMNHLFTPINWSNVKLHSLWGIKNTATERMLTLDRDEENEIYTLTQSEIEQDSVMSCMPMLTGNPDDAKAFISMLNDVPMDAPVGVSDSLVSLELDERINVANLEVVPVKIIC